jgi:mannose-6-phosphate isomerase-like protein (cupin superfamily)
VVELRALTDSLAAIAARQPGRQVPGRPLHRDSATAVFLIRRETSGRPEMHERVAEVFVLQAGRAVVISGGRVVGAGLMEPGEWNGGQIVTDTTAITAGRGGAVARRPAGPGDVVVIPAGVPHQIEVAPGESVTYLVIKLLAVKL